jgi:hypothetical protein
MEITSHSLWTLIHGMGFGALYLLASTGALFALYQRLQPAPLGLSSLENNRFLGAYLSVMAALAWLSVLSGTYIIYPWYRIPAPAGTTNLAAYPRAFLLAHPATSTWHSVGMEWKEHVAWLVPIAITATAVVVLRYGRELSRHPQLKTVLMTFVVSSLIAAGIAGFFGAMLDKNAPVDGGQTLHIAGGESQ